VKPLRSPKHSKHTSQALSVYDTPYSSMPASITEQHSVHPTSTNSQTTLTICLFLSASLLTHSLPFYCPVQFTMSSVPINLCAALLSSEWRSRFSGDLLGLATSAERDEAAWNDVVARLESTPKTLWQVHCFFWCRMTGQRRSHLRQAHTYLTRVSCVAYNVLLVDWQSAIADPEKVIAGQSFAGACQLAWLLLRVL
jgi:hypothetical protein